MKTIVLYFTLMHIRCFIIFIFMFVNKIIWYITAIFFVSTENLFLLLLGIFCFAGIKELFKEIFKWFPLFVERNWLQKFTYWFFRSFKENIISLLWEFYFEKYIGPLNFLRIGFLKPFLCKFISYLRIYI